jgi:hypothetical protein
MIDDQDDAVFGTASRLTDESTFESLQNPRRRRTLQYLTERDGPARVGELADQITAWEQGIDIADIAPEARKSVYNSLTQTHLPHLATRDIVEYDRAAGTVELAPNAVQLARYVSLIPMGDDRWSRAFLATAGVAGLLAVANWLGLFAPVVPAMALNAVVVGLFLAVSLVYAWSVRSRPGFEST